jgi:uncharacterized RDD family membrane protein YckC
MLHLLTASSAQGASPVTVFLSYSSRDRDAVRNLVQDLSDADEQVWMDQRLAGGEAWWRAILEQIRGCDVFIFALSQHSIESKPCQAELQYAQALGLPILPVQVGPVDSMQLNPLATVQAIDYRNPTPNTGMRLIATLHRERARRHPLPSPLPEEPPVPIEYLIRLFTTISNPEYLTPRDQAALVAQLQVGLGEDGQHDAARNDIVMLLTKLHDREDATHRTRIDVEAILASVGAEPPRQPPIAPDTATPVEAAIINDAAKASSDTMAPPERVAHASGPTIVDGAAGATRTPESAVPTEAVKSSVAATPLHGSDQSSVDIGRQDARQKPTAVPKPPPSRRTVTILPPTSAGRRVEAMLIDAFPILIVYGIAGAVAEYLIGKFCEPYIGGYRTVCGGHVTATGLAAIVIGSLVALAYSIWNWGYRQGTTGATIGKSVMKFKVLSKVTGEPVGSDAERIIKVAVLTLVVLLPLSGLVIEAAAHIAGPNYYDRVVP